MEAELDTHLADWVALGFPRETGVSLRGHSRRQAGLMPEPCGGCVDLSHTTGRGSLGARMVQNEQEEESKQRSRCSGRGPGSLEVEDPDREILEMR